jgi:hypothetical protein
VLFRSEQATSELWEESNIQIYDGQWEGDGCGRRQGEKAEDGESNVDMFDTEAEAIERAAVLGCEGVHRAGVKFMPCATHEEWLDLAKSDVDETPDAAPAPAAPTAPAAPAAAGGMKSEEDFLCGFQRKSVNQPCEFCHAKRSI